MSEVLEGRTAEGTGGGNELRSLARAGAFTMVGMGSFGILGLLFNVLVARTLGPRGSGLVFEAVAMSTIAANAVRLGADTGLLVQLPRVRAFGRTDELPRVVLVALAPSLGFGLLAAAGLWFLAPQIAALVLHTSRAGSAPDYVRYVRAQAFFVPLAAACVVMLAGSRGLASTRPYVLIDNIGIPLLRIGLTAVVTAAGMGALAVSIAWGAPLVVGVAAAALAVRRALERYPRAPKGVTRPPLSVTAREFWSFAGPRSFGSIAAVMVAWFDVILVGALRGPEAAGIYSAVSRYLMTGLLAFAAIRVAMGPQLSRLLAEGRRDEAETVFQSATYWLVALSWPFYIALVLFAPTMLRLFGKQFAAGGAPALTILAVAELYDMGTGNVTLVLLMGGRSSWNLMNGGLSLGVNLALNFLLIPHLGLTGAALAWAASIFVENTAAVIEVRFLLRLSPFGPGYLLVAAGAAILVAAGVCARASLGQSFAGLGAWVAGGGALYLCALWRFRKPLRFGHLTAALLHRGTGAPSHG
jgi:O-antigen/teichoic acid export membrane protein